MFSKAPTSLSQVCDESSPHALNKQCKVSIRQRSRVPTPPYQVRIPDLIFLGRCSMKPVYSLQRISSGLLNHKMDLGMIEISLIEMQRNCDEFALNDTETILCVYQIVISRTLPSSKLHLLSTQLAPEPSSDQCASRHKAGYLHPVRRFQILVELYFDSGQAQSSR